MSVVLSSLETIILASAGVVVFLKYRRYKRRREQGVREIKISFGGFLVGILLGYLTSKLTERRRNGIPVAPTTTRED